ncbi:MAG: pyridoxal phosphate-dependent aminotransferase [Bryobacteraceae bacterium]
MTVLNRQQKTDILARGFTRRSFGRIGALLGAGAALPFYNEPALAQLSRLRSPLPPGAVKINANENPLGPCPEALDAMRKALVDGGRYQYEETFSYAQTLAEQEGVPANYVLPFAGSSDPLHRVVLAYASPEKAFVTADPGYEAGERAARYIGAKVAKVPLTKEYGHDVKGMLSAHASPGVFYICNPNNPTGTTTPRADIEYLLANKPAGSILLLDEAYIHFTDEPFGTDLVAKDKDVIVLRTFSKLYGMAGLRAGAAIGRPDLLAKIMNYGAGAMPATGMAGAKASLLSKPLVAERKKIVRDIRNDQFAFLDKQRIPFVPSVSNKFMMDVRQPAQEFVAKMQAEKIFVGRSWPAWPTHVRVTVGTMDEMKKFQAAVRKVLA